MTMSERSTLPDLLPMGSHVSTSLQPDSPAKTQARRERERGLKATDPDFGGTQFASRMSVPQGSYCWRTILPFWREASAPFSGQWPKSGLVLGGIAYRLRTSARVTSAKDFGLQVLFPTPRANGSNNAGGSNSRKRALRDGVYISGSMNPNHREWLMGFPDGWTEIPPLETRSSRKSRKS